MRLSSPYPQLRPEQGCVVSYCPIASSFGSRVLREGGNAVDAAVATALALAVTYPQAGNIGGGGFLLVYEPEEPRAHFLDYRETAPRQVDLAKLRAQPQEQPMEGALSVGVPGTIAGLAAALERFGTFAWDRVLGPIIELAEAGTWLTTRQAGYLSLFADAMRRHPSTARSLLRDGAAPSPGTRFAHPDLARTLRRLAEAGPGDFYSGAIASQIIDEVRRGGGTLAPEDLASYTPVWRVPLERELAGRRLFTAPLPSGGGLVLALALGLLEAETRDGPVTGLARAQLLARIFRVAFAIRQLAGDPDALPARDVELLNERARRTYEPGELDRLERELVSPRRAPSGGASTTHFCVIDAGGVAVSNTYTLNTMFGSKLVVGGAGFLLNNCLDDFFLGDERPNWYELVDGERNLLSPGRRPVSSMTPTIIAGDRGAELVIGGSGGPRIPTMLAQIVADIVLWGRRLEDAIRAPRVHHQLIPEEIVLERGWPDEVAEALVASGHVIARAPLLGLCSAIQLDAARNEMSAALDGRLTLE